MMKQESNVLVCDNCKDRNYCMMQWGLDCKRQGGKKIPRMKYMLENKLKNEVNSKRPIRFRNAKSRTISDGIKTKLFSW